MTHTKTHSPNQTFLAITGVVEPDGRLDGWVYTNRCPVMVGWEGGVGMVEFLGHSSIKFFDTKSTMVPLHMV